MNTTLFSKTLKKLRTDRDISQGLLAKQLFVDRSTINRWENGTRLPDNLMIARISKALEADINVLLSATLENDEFMGMTINNEIALLRRRFAP